MVTATMTNERAMAINIVNWLVHEAKQRDFDVVFADGEKLCLEDETLVSVPAVVKSGKSAGEKASILQQLEDKWNDEKQSGQPDLILVPMA